MNSQAGAAGIIPKTTSAAARLMGRRKRSRPRR